MKSHFAGFFLFLSILACNKKEYKKTSVVELKIETIYEDTISIRAIEVWNDTTLWFASDQGKFGALIGSTPKIAQLRYNDSLLVIRSIAKTNNSIFLLSSGNPAVLYKTYFDGNEVSLMSDVYVEEGKKVFYNSIVFWDDLNGIAIGDPTENCLSVLLTSNSGLTWRKISCENLPKTVDSEAAFAASNTSVSVFGSHAWIGSGGKKARVFHTPDFGKTWEVFDTPIISGKSMTGIYSIAFDDEKNGIIFGGDWNAKQKNMGNKAVTKDGGKTWQLVSEGRNPGYRSCVQYLPDSKGQELVAIGSEGIDYSADGGKTWKNLSPEGFYTIRFANDSLAFAAGKGRISRLIFKRE
ncbi:MAG: oxidoreductase [Flavobacteriales bacterium CG_4_9_14_3_um_filter_40_17]|nr:MAG: oxidoreductase [Flavobacteriales bacterium CG_4_9_14_3_um_filter_40_17]